LKSKPEASVGAPVLFSPTRSLEQPFVQTHGALTAAARPHTLIYFEHRSILASQLFDDLPQHGVASFLVKKKKTLEKELKAAHNLYKKKIADEAKARRQQERENEKKEKEAKVTKRVDAKAQKERDRRAATT
jgi:hypothetical protein